MRKLAPILLLRLALLVAVLACAVLVVEYQNVGDPAFCGMASGCMAVRRSPWSRIGGVPLPVLGLVAQSTLFAFALLVRDKVHTYYLAAVATAGGGLALGLLGLQAFQIGAFCKWCVMVDSSAIVAALAAGWLHHEVSASADAEARLGELARRRAVTIAWAAGAALAGSLPIVWGAHPVVPPLPAGVAALAAPGKVTVVAFTDFECPYCRKLAPEIHEMVDASGGRMALVRKMVPLDGHPGAAPAARAYLCTPDDRKEQMAEALYRAAPPVLTRDGTIALAEAMKLDKEAFARCLDAPATAAALSADIELFKSLDSGALPFTFVGPRVVAGNQPAILHKVARAVLAGDHVELPVRWMLALFAAIAAALAAMTLRLAPRDDAPLRDARG